LVFQGESRLLWSFVEDLGGLWPLWHWLTRPLSDLGLKDLLALKLPLEFVWLFEW
jgi:hypothetical protein